MKNKLLKHALILGALMGCMATALGPEMWK